MHEDRDSLFLTLAGLCTQRKAFIDICLMGVLKDAYWLEIPQKFLKVVLEAKVMLL